ncbi:MAG: amidohydrolase family protein [Candidatus Eiseniibacteriota bacterium]
MTTPRIASARDARSLPVVFAQRALALVFTLAVAAPLLPGTTRAATDPLAPPAGLRERTPRVHAFTNARLVLAPGRTVARGTLVARDGTIVAVGADVKPPADAVIVDCEGATIYPGLFDPLVELDLPAREGAGRGGAGGGGGGGPGSGGGAAGATRGAAYWNPYVTPELRIEREVLPDSATVRKLRDQGVTTIAAVPSRGVIRGGAAVLTLADGPLGERLLLSQAALNVAFEPPATWQDRGHPNSEMGAYTLIRQAFFDADWYAKAQAAWTKDRTLPRPHASDALTNLGHFTAGKAPVLVKANTEMDVLRADRLAKELSLDVIVRGSGREYRRLDDVKATGRPIIVPVAFPRPPLVETPEQAMNSSLESLMHWDIAPENPARLAKAGVRMALTSDRLEDRAQLLQNVRRAVDRGLSADDALRALTVTPAAFYGLDDHLGTLEVGKLAHLVVTDGDLFTRRAKVWEVWIDGERYEAKRRPEVDARGRWVLAPTPLPRGLAPTDTVAFTLEEQADTLGGKVKLGREVKVKRAGLLEHRLYVAAPGDSAGLPGYARFSATVKGDALVGGEGEWPDGTPFRFTGRRVAPYVAAPDSAKKPPAPASFAVTYPLGEKGRESAAPPEQPAVVAFVGGTVWTSGPAGKIENATVVVTKGKITAVGAGLKPPGNAQVVDLKGKHLSPGLIDCHSHTATDGGINEGGQTITAEVRIGDYIDPNDDNIYRQLAGGLTAAHVLHGSANTIGGQCQLLKLRWGQGPEALKFENCPPTIKFALGENVKQSNWDGPTTRFPQTRMGVEQLLRDAFQAAREYDQAWKKPSSKTLPPRRDLELEALAEVLRGERTIHWHSYRQDEILMAMRVCDDFKVPSGTFQHILEGYKVADEMAKRKWGASSFSDWWAYKFEVQDAIPYNGALMRQAGVVVSFNSDSDELARRLNTEAGKAVKYGGVPEAEALKFVTLNPATQLKVQDRVGSIETGKDADLVVWSGPPLSTLSRCEQTWIEGRKYFDRADDLARREVEGRMRATLIQKALGETTSGSGWGFGGRRGVVFDVVDQRMRTETNEAAGGATHPGDEPDQCEKGGAR